MPEADLTCDDRTESLHREYVLDVRIVEVDDDLAELYADVYFDVNGFEEAGTGERGVPPVVIGAGRDTLAAYLLTLPGVDRHWVASFFGFKPPRVERHVDRVRTRAAEIREGALERGVEAVQ
ncbi:hypothetical protein BRC70_06210 [Halobacteriales archaeon QH_6_68_27]|nr:MAG: hypothetical protein BRC70_06210 [Halobacteriales archaeon QH_6_68_27]